MEISMKFMDKSEGIIISTCDYCLRDFNDPSVVEVREEFSTSTRYFFNLCSECYKYFGDIIMEPDDFKIRLVARRRIFDRVHKFRIKCKLSNMLSNGWTHVDQRSQFHR